MLAPIVVFQPLRSRFHDAHTHARHLSVAAAIATAGAAVILAATSSVAAAQRAAAAFAAPSRARTLARRSWARASRSSHPERVIAITNDARRRTSCATFPPASTRVYASAIGRKPDSSTRHRRRRQHGDARLRAQGRLAAAVGHHRVGDAHAGRGEQGRVDGQRADAGAGATESGARVAGSAARDSRGRAAAHEQPRRRHGADRLDPRRRRRTHGGAVRRHSDQRRVGRVDRLGSRAEGDARSRRGRGRRNVEPLRQRRDGRRRSRSSRVRSRRARWTADRRRQPRRAARLRGGRRADRRRAHRERHAATIRRRAATCSIDSGEARTPIDDRRRRSFSATRTRASTTRRRRSGRRSRPGICSATPAIRARRFRTRTAISANVEPRARLRRDARAGLLAIRAWDGRQIEQQRSTAIRAVRARARTRTRACRRHSESRLGRVGDVDARRLDRPRVVQRRRRLPPLPGRLQRGGLQHDLPRRDLRRAHAHDSRRAALRA